MGSCQSMSPAVSAPKDGEESLGKEAELTGATSKPSSTHSRRLTDENADQNFMLIEVEEDGTLPPSPAGSNELAAVDHAADTSANDGNREEIISDAVGLEELKSSIKADGPLHETVVRMETPIGIPIEEVYDGVHDGRILGSGVEGVVRLVQHRETGVEYASKSIDIGLIKDDESLTKLRNEISIMCQVDHPNIVRLEEVYESESEIYLVQELCLGGDLFDRLDAMPDYHYTENQCARLVKQMLSALLYLHSKNIIHRDLKLENFLFSSSDPDDSVLKLVDFGLSKHFEYGEIQHEAVGTPYTVAPEVIRGSYDERSDLWAVGVITYLLLSGETPFGGCDGEEVTQVRDNILRGFVNFEPEEYWENTSGAAKDFIRVLLVADYRDRPSAKDTLRHRWIERVTNGHNHDMNGDGSMHGNGINPNVVKALVSFKEYSVMRKLLLEILSFTLLPEQITGLQGDFEKLDVDSDGEISLAELKLMLVKNAGAGSLGSLTEAEVEQIFDALRVRKSETTVRWHEFIAAGLSQCKIDERNIRLAFNRLDVEGKGYVTFDDIMEIVGSNGNREELQVLWRESIRNEPGVRSDAERIQYDDFFLLMKGQTQQDLDGGAGAGDGAAQSQQAFVPSSSGASKQQLRVVGDQIDTADDYAAAAEPPRVKLTAHNVNYTGGARMFPASTRAKSMVHMKPLPTEEEEEKDGDDDGANFRYQLQSTTSDSLRSLLLPGRRESLQVVDRVIHDDTKTPLVIGKTVYRTNREMRLSILEAVKRFEEKRAKRRLLNGERSGKGTGKGGGAGLIMQRRGSSNAIAPAKAKEPGIPASEEEEEEETLAMMARAKRRSGRSQHRYRSASDLTGMLLIPPA